MPPAIAAPFAPAREIAAIAILTFWFVAFMDASQNCALSYGLKAPPAERRERATSATRVDQKRSPSACGRAGARRRADLVGKGDKLLGEELSIAFGFVGQ